MVGNVRVAIIGGSGFWSEESHHKHLLALEKDYPVRLVAIVDPVDPHTVKVHENLQMILSKHNPEWLNPKDFESTDQIITQLQEKMNVNLVIIASTPCTHFEYGVSCIEHGMNVICDKPIISHNNAATDPVAANQIVEQYDVLLEKYRAAKKKYPNLLFHSILRRRSLKAFMHVAEEIEKVHKATGAGVNNMTIIVNGGKYKFPAELNAAGAHGYLEGVGSLSHSAYHYIDVMTWYLTNAPGVTAKIKPQLNYVFRISDYLKAKSYEPLAKTIKESQEALQTPELTKETLGCELNAGFSFNLYDSKDQMVGAISFLFNLISFTPRVLRYDKNVHEPADRKGGGRMSHIIMDIHQDGLQTWQIVKNDIVFEDNKLHAVGRRHPHIEGEPYEELTYEKAYHSGKTLDVFLGEAISSVANDAPIENHPVIRSLEEERLATELYGTCYKLLADNFAGNSQTYEIMVKE